MTLAIDKILRDKIMAMSNDRTLNTLYDSPGCVGFFYLFLLLNELSHELSVRVCSICFLNDRFCGFLFFLFVPWLLVLNVNMLLPQGGHFSARGRAQPRRQIESTHHGRATTTRHHE